MVKEKQCKECGEIKPLKAFRVAPRGEHGRADTCKICRGASAGHIVRIEQSYFNGEKIEDIPLNRHNNIVRELKREYEKEIERLMSKIRRLTLQNDLKKV